MPRYTGGQMIVNYLIKEGVPYIFGIAGHGVLGLLDAGYDYRDRIKLVMVRHEEVAGFMADGYYRIAHRPVATFTSSGPGSINLLIALAEAMSDSVPFLSLTGNVATTQFNSGALQETYRQREADFPSVIRHYVKQTFQATRPEMLPKVLALAFKTMLSGRGTTGAGRMDSFGQQPSARESNGCGPGGGPAVGGQATPYLGWSRRVAGRSLG
jgi:acetolactate synthase-1/2/3 large subunit